MRRVVFLMITVGAALLWLGAADTASAICHHCQGRGGGCSECGEVCGGCGECGGCARHHDCCLNPVKAVKWVLRALGGACACGGCDQDVYYGPYTRDCDPCDRCGNHRGGPAGYSRGYSYAPQQGEVVTSMPSAPSGGCNCNKGRVSQSVTPRPTSSYATARPSAVRQEYSATRAPSAPKGSYASRSASDPYAPRLISVTDEVVRPAAPQTRTASAPLNLPTER